MTRQLIVKLQNEGDISPLQVNKFFRAVRDFFSCAITYALENLPINDPVLQNSEFVNFSTRASASISQVTYFVTRYELSLYTSGIILII